MVLRIIRITLVVLLFQCCTERNHDNAEDILKNTLKSHGNTEFFNSEISFNLKKTKYTIKHDKGNRIYSMRQTFGNDLHEIIYDEGTTTYFIEDSIRPSETYDKQIISLKLESFLYTSLIPHYFNSFKSLSLSQLSDVTIRSKPYHSIKIKVPSEKSDLYNTFILYIDTNKSKIDYLALNYEDHGSIQFRRLINYRKVGGIIFNDFIAFKPFLEDSVKINSLYKRFNVGQLEPLPTVTFDSVSVKPNNQSVID